MGLRRLVALAVGEAGFGDLVLDADILAPTAK
jgi:hypothetical protein